ncbi:Tim10/DDP family zinc finger containing protein [Novymonas esmeraldas]|uniref:Tim10/DDP family zinc finger containing protein n=1 Tax=Novymonas esmeraldas TaxID=1808958 RepID=A0AAW0ELE3_9TRYP
MQPVQPNPQLAGLSQSEVVILSEKLYHVGHTGFHYCSRRCITHFGEDSIPHHPGEKACLSRCLSKVRNGMDMAIAHKKDFEEKLRDGQLPYQWMKDAAAGNM